MPSKFLAARIVPMENHSKPDISIDEFLSHYTHQECAILDFISCLDEVDQAETFPREQNAMKSVPKVKGKSTQHTSKSTFVPDLISKKNLNKTANFDLKSKKSLEKGQHKLLNKKLTAEEREERRRHQNREAQRRYRDRQMKQASIFRLTSTIFQYRAVPC